MTERHTDSNGAYQDQVEVTGRVLAVDIPKRQCQLWLDDATYVNIAFTEKQEPCISNAFMSRKHRELTVRGKGEFTPDGVLKRIVRADELSLSFDMIEPRDPNSPRGTAHDLMERIAKRFENLPEEELERFPADFAKRASERSHGIFRE